MNKKKTDTASSRRKFLKNSLKGAVGTLALANIPTIVPAHVLKGPLAPSNRINVGAIGNGRISREQILESLIAPGNRLAPGFGMVTLELKDGKKITGVLQGESKAGITIKEGLDPERTIAAANIVKKNYAPSSMPDMKAILSKKEIRDVVSFLAESNTDD
mgnify:CR=1 FL=1